MKKPELLVTPTCLEDIALVAEAGATAIIIGEQRFGLRLAGEFQGDALKQAIEVAHEHGLKAYVAVNALFHNDMLPALQTYIAFVAEAKADAIVFGDPAVLMYVREIAPEMKLHWNTETTATNYFTCNYWGQRGAKRAVLAREINMDAVIEMKEHAEVEIEVQVHGMTCMFQSKRSLVGNYFEYQGRMMDIEKKKQESNMFLYDKARGTKYPIFEDVNGTHIMSPNDICMIDELGEMLDAGVDAFKIEGILKSTAYLVAVTKKYRQAIDMYLENPAQYEEMKDTWHKEIEEIQPVNRPLDTGFFFKETVY